MACCAGSNFGANPHFNRKTRAGGHAVARRLRRVRHGGMGVEGVANILDAAAIPWRGWLRRSCCWRPRLGYERREAIGFLVADHLTKPSVSSIPRARPLAVKGNLPILMGPRWVASSSVRRRRPVGMRVNTADRRRNSRGGFAGHDLHGGDAFFPRPCGEHGPR